MRAVPPWGLRQLAGARLGECPISRSVEIPSPSLTRRTISKVRDRLRVITSDSRSQAALESYSGTPRRGEL
jgi:hypothetical protein